MAKRYLFIALVCLFLTASCALLDSEPTGPQISRGVPSTAYLYVHAWHNAEKDFLDPCYDRVFKAFDESGFVDAANGVIEEIVGSEGGSEIKAQCGHYRDLIAAVDWKAIVSDEFVFAVEAGETTHYHLALGRMAQETATANFDALGALFADVAGLDESISRVDWQRGEARGITLDFGHPDMPLTPTVACLGEIMVLSTRRELAETALDLVFGGETEVVSLSETGKFRDTFAQLPSAGDELFYMEPAKIFSAYDNSAFGEQNFQIGPDSHTIGQFFHVIEPYILLADRIASVSTTRDRRLCEDSIEIPAADWKERPVTALFRDRVAPGDIDRLVPADALSFSISNGIDPTVFYDMLVALFKEVAPTMSEPLLLQWETIQDQFGIKLRDDWLACIDGGVVNMSFPAKRPNQFSTSDSIAMVMLKDGKKAADLFEHWVGVLTGMLKDPENPVAAGLAQANVNIALLPVERDGFTHGRKLSISVMPFIQPVAGFFGRYFVIASSESALNTYFAFLEGEAPGILESADFSALALDLPAGFRSAAFSDQGASFRELGQFLSMSGMFTMMIPETAETKIMKKIIGLAPYLAPVLDSLDFFGHQGTYSIFDEETGVFRGRKVIRYRVEEM
jgi:hypothetical protein